MKSEGKCRFCKNIFSGSMMARHLMSCKERIAANKLDGGQNNVYLIKAACDPFFVFFEINDSSTLLNVDNFLRDLWLECCGHMSAFKIGNVSYSSYPNSEFEDKNMNAKLSKILKPNTSFTYEYDFGTTTHLGLKCISQRKGNVKGLNIIARNSMPELKCESCQKPAKEICSQCFYEGDSLLCESCAKTHKCGEEMLLPLVNSPRSGMCGYTGDDCRLLGEDKNI
jgi:hypothetical protein